MKKVFTEKNLVAFLFVVVVLFFHFANKDSKGIEHMYKKALSILQL